MVFPIYFNCIYENYCFFNIIFVLRHLGEFSYCFQQFLQLISYFLGTKSYHLQIKIALLPYFLFDTTYFFSHEQNFQEKISVDNSGVSNNSSFLAY